jgi:hypothetical protein
MEFAPRTAPVALCVLLVVNALVIGLISSLEQYDSTSSGPIFAIAAAAPYLALAVLARRSPRPFVYGAIVMAQLLAFFTAAMLLVILSMGWSDTPGGEGPLGAARLVVVLVAVAQLAGAVWAIVATRGWRASGARGEALAGGAAMFAWPALAGAVAMQASVSLDRGLVAKHERAEQSLVRAAVRVQRCALGWAEQHPDAGYPRTIAEMGPTGSRCLGPDDVVARDKGWSLAYVVSSPDSSGRAPSFVVHGASQPGPGGSVWRVWGDTSATLRRGWGGTSVPGDGIPALVHDLRACVEAVRADGELPGDLGQLWAAIKRYPLGYAARGCNTGVARQSGDSLDTRLLAGMTGYRISYARNGDGYRVEARPVKFGETALRSYVLADSGPVHFTLDDRPATLDDAVLPPCAPFGVGDCTPTALDAPPEAAFAYPPAIRFDSVYDLHIRVKGDTNSPFVGLEWNVECNARPLGTPAIAPRKFNALPVDPRCDALSRTDSAFAGDSIVVRLWLRNRAHMVAHTEGTIRVVRGPLPR